MSGIYIPNFEPSKEGYDCVITCDGYVVKPTSTAPYAEIYEAIPVPDHGRLGDLDALEARLRLYEPPLDFSLKEVTAAPTIIPADKEEANDG